MEEEKGGRNLIVILVIIVVLAIIAAIWLSVRGPETTPGTNGTAAISLSFQEAQEANRAATLEVPDQFPGSIVYVSNANLPAGGWVAVRQVVGGQPAMVIGQSYFGPDSRIGNIELSEVTMEGQSYVAEVYTDDGDESFATSTDALVVSETGLPLSVPFLVTRDLPERKG